MTADRDLRAALMDDLEQIEDNAGWFHSGRNSAYQAVAIQLRNILLKGRRGLMSRVLPDARLHQLCAVIPGSPPGEGLIPIIVMGRVKLALTGDRSRYRYELDIDENLPTLDVDAWLGQWILRPTTELPDGTNIPGFTIREVIAETANDEVAHTNERVGPTLERMTGYVARGDSVTQREYQMLVVGIGEYVARRCRTLLAEAPASENLS